MVQLITTWANRTYAPDEYEMVHAWDEWSVDANERGFHESRQEALDSMDTDLLHSATIIVEIPYEAIRDAVSPKTVKVAGRVL